MVKDRKIQTAGHNNHFYALKVQKSAEHYTEAAMDEVELLDCIASERRQCEADLLSNAADIEACRLVEHSRFVATLHDHFFHTGPNGRHMCMLFSMLGCNLLSVIKAFNYRGIPVEVVKKMTAGVCRGLDFLHSRCHIIHTDLVRREAERMTALHIICARGPFKPVSPIISFAHTYALCFIHRNQRMYCCNFRIRSAPRRILHSEWPNSPSIMLTRMPQPR